MIPEGFPNGDDLIQFLIDEKFISETVSDSERYEEVMEAVSESFLSDIRRQNFIQDSAPVTRTFSFGGGNAIIPPFGIFTLTSMTNNGDVFDITNFKLRAMNRFGAFMQIDTTYICDPALFTATGIFGMVPEMPVYVKRALLSRGASDLYDGIEGTSSYVGSREIKKITQGPVTVEYDVGTKNSNKTRDLSAMKMTYKRVVDEFRLRTAY